MGSWKLGSQVVAHQSSCRFCRAPWAVWLIGPDARFLSWPVAMAWIFQEVECCQLGLNLCVNMSELDKLISSTNNHPRQSYHLQVYGSLWVLHLLLSLHPTCLLGAKARCFQGLSGHEVQHCWTMPWLCLSCAAVVSSRPNVWLWPPTGRVTRHKMSAAKKPTTTDNCHVAVVGWQGSRKETSGHKKSIKYSSSGSRKYMEGLPLQAQCSPQKNISKLCTKQATAPRESPPQWSSPSACTLPVTKLHQEMVRLPSPLCAGRTMLLKTAGTLNSISHVSPEKGALQKHTPFPQMPGLIWADLGWLRIIFWPSCESAPPASICSACWRTGAVAGARVSHWPEAVPQFGFQPLGWRNSPESWTWWYLMSPKPWSKSAQFLFKRVHLQ